MSRPGKQVTHVVRSDGFAGVERYICTTATELTRRGWKVAVIGGDPNAMRAALPSDVEFKAARTTAEVARAIWSSRPHTLLHTHMTAAETAALPLKGLVFRRWVTTRHFAAPRGSTLPGRLAGPLIAHRIDAQISVSQFVADALSEPSVVIPSGVPRNVLAPVEREHTVVMVQRFQPEKDTATGVRAWALSGLADDGWRMRVFGDGTERTSLESLARDLGVEDSVCFEGFHPEPHRAFAKAGIVLATTPREGFGFSVVEAMSAGAPVIAADGGAHRETLGAGASLFTPHDAVGAAALLRQLADDGHQREALGERLQRRYTQDFTIATHVDRLEVVYQR